MLRLDVQNESATTEILCDRIIANGRRTLGESLLKQLHVVTAAPHFYVLGSKSFGSDSDAFTMQEGFQQIRHLFEIIGGRSGLDLYATMTKLLPS